MRRGRWRSVGAVLLLAAVGPARADEPAPDRRTLSPPTTFSPGPTGTKALYLLLEQLGASTRRLRRSDYGHLAPDEVLWVLSDASFGRLERRELNDFLHEGGTVIAFAEPAASLLREAFPDTDVSVDVTGSPYDVKKPLELELPGLAHEIVGGPPPLETWVSAGVCPIVASWKVGQGELIAIGASELVENGTIGRAANGVFLAHLALDRGRSHVFDEAKLGFGTDDLAHLVARLPYRWGLAQLAGVALLAAVGFSRRRRPALAAAPIRRRRDRDHVDAVAAFWERAGDAGVPLDAFMRSMTERARANLQRTAEVGAEEPFVGWVGRASPRLLARAQTTWALARALSAAGHPDPAAVQQVMADILGLEREARTW